jgi:nucleoside-diphosphate-sugar epimerase
MIMGAVLVTGAAGLLGRAVVDQLADTGTEVHALVRDRSQSHRDDVAFHEVDLARPLYASGLPGRIDAVLHLAQAREFRDFPRSAPQVFAINVASTAFLLDWALSAGATHFVSASSGGVYRAGGEVLTEDAPLQDLDRLGYYLATKASSEALVASYAAQLVPVSLRYFFIYGPRQAREMLIPRLYDRVRAGEPIALQGEHGMRINPVHASDAAAATIAALQLDTASVVNVAGPQTVSLRELGQLFGRDLGVEPAFDSTPGEPANLVASIESMSSLLRAPSMALADALADIRV